ncbi:MAG: hypothetical protein LWX23_01220 [Spirochaetia bacterium]|nr:hypothetical protein [Spirochaetia bacterium]MCE1208075.1 hypothetical protein [Spirochaetia bacterium]
MGRYEWSNRGILELTPSVKICDLVWRGLLTSEGEADFGQLHAFRFLKTFNTSGVNPAQLEPYTMLEDGSVWIRAFLGERESTGSHKIVKQYLPYGGFRHFFICNGCGRRVKAIYFYEGEISCRHCLHLVYQKSRDHRNRSMMLRTSMSDCLKALELKGRGHPIKGKRLEERSIKEIEEYSATLQINIQRQKR